MDRAVFRRGHSALDAGTETVSSNYEASVRGSLCRHAFLFLLLHLGFSTQTSCRVYVILSLSCSPPIGATRRVFLPVCCRAVKYDLETAQLKDNGVFWIDFASIVQYFRNVFMNWNPALFSHRYRTRRCLFDGSCFFFQP